MDASDRPSGTYARVGKRTIDLLASAAGVTVALPVLVAVAIGSKLRQGSPVLFSQSRAGRDGRPFVLWKFRTMRQGGGADEERLTGWGRLLRHSSLDELPQLFNVLAGDMSLIGPRPLYLHYVPLYSAEQAKRLLVRPGLSGLAQVSGRNRLGWEERLRLDTEYATSYSLRLDARILAATVAHIVRRSPTSALAGETPGEFLGQ